MHTYRKNQFRKFGRNEINRKFEISISSGPVNKRLMVSARKNKIIPRARRYLKYLGFANSIAMIYELRGSRMLPGKALCIAENVTGNDMKETCTDKHPLQLKRAEPVKPRPIQGELI